MAAMLDLEEHIKEIAADIIAYSFGLHQEDYLQYRNYQNKRKRKPRFSLPGILDTLKKTLDTDKNPIQHYRIEHGIIPPWILFLYASNTATPPLTAVAYTIIHVTANYAAMNYSIQRYKQTYLDLVNYYFYLAC